jgi:sarcosine oxidase subunit alpha
MSEHMTMTAGHRLPPKSTEIIDRHKVIHFKFEDKTYSAHPGDTIGSALMAHGVQLISRSFKYHRPRGLLCCTGHCPNCLVQIGSEPNVRACKRLVEDGMVVAAQNARPSLARDVMALTQLGHRFMPVGFYYKTFIHPQRLWPFYEKVLRNAAGLGKVDLEAVVPEDYRKQYIHCDVAIIGGGPAGLQAALTAAEAGIRVALFDEHRELGGHIRFTHDAETNAFTDPPSNLHIYRKTTVVGWWEDHWLAAVSENCLFKIRARSVIVATGAIEQPSIFENNDLPGVMLGSGIQNLVNLFGVKPGENAIIVTANDQGWQLAADLIAADINVVAIVEERPAFSNSLVKTMRENGVTLHWQHTIRRAEGSGKVEKAIFAPVEQADIVEATSQKTLQCDLIAVSVGWAPANGLLYQAGATITYDPDRAIFGVEHLPDGVFCAGRVNGTFSVEASMSEGERAGQEAAAFVKNNGKPEPVKMENQGRHNSILVRKKGQGKRFVCFCEDVTEKDVETAIAEGYDSIELLKRYSTISMGPCQGKMCSLNTIHLCAQINGRSVTETGTTTSRPPIFPVKLGTLAGQIMEPVRLTPVHQWHLDHGATMMVAGQWLRAEHYGDAEKEVTAVRQSVGLIDVSTLGKFKLSGPGVPDFLSKIYVNNWRKLPIGRVRYGLMCNDEGIILDDGVTARLEEQEWYMTTTTSGAGVIFEWLQWWMQSGWGDGIHAANVSENRAAFNLAGPKSRAVLQTLTDADLSNDAFAYMHVIEATLAGIPCRMMRIGFTGELSYEIHCPAAYGRPLWETLMAAGAVHGIVPFGVEAQRILRLEKGHIIVGQDTDALADPLSAGMEGLVKLDKEDFLGQRTLTQIHSSGTRQRLAGFKMIDKGIVPEEGLQIVKPNSAQPLGLEIIGWITSSRYSPTLDEVIGLCWLPEDLAGQQGEAFSIYKDGQQIQARVHQGAFYDVQGSRLRS